MDETGPKEKESKAVEQDVAKQEPVPTPDSGEMQYLFVQLADGRRGAFIGPVLIKEAELLLSPPRIYEVMFSKPIKREGANAEKKEGSEAIVGVPSGDDKKGVVLEPKA